MWPVPVNKSGDVVTALDRYTSATNTVAAKKVNSMLPWVFVPMIGQYENIGDIVLRRPLMNWLRSGGVLHVFIGRAPAGYAEGLGVRSEDVVYRSFAKWYAAAMQAALKGRACYAFKPGEIQLSLSGLKEHVSALPLISAVRLRGGGVIRVGSGARNFAWLPRALIKPSIALSELVMWRDARTAEYLGVGGVMPDLGFWEGDSVNAMLPVSSRNALVVSMRGDRESRAAVWVDAVREYARSRRLELWVVTQVHRDSSRSRALAAALGAELLDWDGTNHHAQEARLRDLYRRTHMVISDRLHVLIAAFTHGALPCGLLPYASDKIDRHFAAAGIADVTIQLSDDSKAELAERFSALEPRRGQLLAELQVARQRLDEVRTAVVRCVGVPHMRPLGKRGAW